MSHLHCSNHLEISGVHQHLAAQQMQKAVEALPSLLPSVFSTLEPHKEVFLQLTQIVMMKMMMQPHLPAVVSHYLRFIVFYTYLLLHVHIPGHMQSSVIHMHIMVSGFSYMSSNGTNKKEVAAEANAGCLDSARECFK